MSMTIKTTASQFKAKLGVFMRAVRAGKEVLVTDRDQPVARLVPIRGVPEPEVLRTSRPADPTAPSLGKVDVRGISPRHTDTTAMLREDRQRR